MKPPITVEHHPGPRVRRFVRRCWDFFLALLDFLLAPACDLNTKDKP